MSKSLLQAGGQRIYTECHQQAPNGIEFAETVLTSGGNLKCQYIVHGACCQWDGTGESEKVLTAACVCFSTTQDNLPFIECLRLLAADLLNLECHQTLSSFGATRLAHFSNHIYPITSSTLVSVVM